ncbi:MAG TPA: TOMM system kinase/cyclase fusion protein [Kofleriaceae bacterium]|nr:TOMM system kinase/cyclase fusion protein [Kofleriaceae bacterium]
MKDAHDLRAGSVLQGRYEIVSALGSGGFGAVYKAIQLATHQPVAIKVMHPIVDDAEAKRDNRVARFRREMDLCARLQHPNIVGLVDSGQTEDGRLFAAFQFASGRGLDRVLLEDGPMNPREARYLMSQVLDALSCAHNLGVVHRDLKPANIMLVSTGTRRNALVLDFGIGAMAHDINDPSQAKLTGQHEWLGTPHYTAPEQIRGYPPTSQSDIYSWGLVYLECLLGYPVIAGTPVMAWMFHLGPDPVPIPPQLRHHPLGRLLQRAVIKDVTERTATASSLLRELDDCDVSDLQRFAGGIPGTMVNERLQPMVPAALGTSPAGPHATPGSLATPGSAPGRDRLVDGERRQITAVCCSVSPTPGLDLDDLDALIQTQYEICTRVAEQFHGELAGGLGHQVLVEFGYPTASEDDVVRAARAALAIRAAVVERNTAVPDPRRMQIRLGLHTGMVAYDPHEAEARISSRMFGMTTMIASQLSAAAAADSIVASAATAQALRAHILMTPIGTHVIEGVSRGIQLFRVESVRARAIVRDTQEGGPARPLVGRDREMALLLERWTQVAAGAGQCVLVTGEAGIGKSRLATELSRRIGARSHILLEARCTLETSNRVLHPILEVLERVLDLGDIEPATRLDRIEAALIEFGFRPGDVVPLVAALLSVPHSDRYPSMELAPNRRRELTLDMVVSLLIELSERTPVVLFVEDLHWADPTTLDLLSALVAAIPSSRVLALFTARPDFTPPWPNSATDQIQLARLTRPQVAQIVAMLTGGKALPASVLEQMLSRADGVPLFVEELTRMVLESGVLTARGDLYVLTGSLSEVAIPTTLRASLMARLDRLGRAKKTAQLAAALGREFDLALLIAVGSLDEAAVQEDLERLAAVDLVHHKRRLRNPTWLFRHALIRDTAYESMPRRVQQKVHARIAEVIEQQFPDMAHTRPDLLALHHLGAEQKAQAIRYAQKAALNALMGSAYSHAIHHAKEAIGWLDAIPPRTGAASSGVIDLPPEDVTPGGIYPMARIDRIEAELSLRVTLGVPLMLTQGFASKEVEANYLRLLELCQLAGDRAVSRQFPALWGLWTFRLISGDHAGAQEAAARLTTLGERTGDTGIRLAALTAHGTAIMMRGRIAEARRVFEDALSLYDPIAHAGLAVLFGQDAGAMCAAFLTWVHAHDTDRSRAETRAGEAMEMCDALAQPSTRAFVETVLATWRCLRGDFTEAERHAEVALRLAADQGMPHWHAQAQITRGWAIAGLGRAAEGAAITRAGINALTGIGSKAGMTFYWGALAEAELAAGHIDQATTALEEAVRYMALSGERIHQAGLALIEAKIALATGQRDAASDALARALAVAYQQEAGEIARRAKELRLQLDASYDPPRRDSATIPSVPDILS